MLDMPDGLAVGSTVRITKFIDFGETGYLTGDMHRVGMIVLDGIFFGSKRESGVVLQKGYSLGYGLVPFDSIEIVSETEFEAHKATQKAEQLQRMAKVYRQCEQRSKYRLVSKDSGAVVHFGDKFRADIFDNLTLTDVWRDMVWADDEKGARRKVYAPQLAERGYVIEEKPDLKLVSKIEPLPYEGDEDED